MFTVQELAKTAGITRRTLHYYDEIGLLKPSRIGDNGYRYYGEEAVLRLQQILLYREMDLPLAEIHEIMGRRDFDVLRALETHRDELSQRIRQLEHLKRTVDDTILHLKGKKQMSHREFFRGFTDAEQKEYEKQAMDRYDPETVRASNQKWKSYSAADKQRIADEGNAVYQAWVDAIPKGAASPQAQAAVDQWRRHMDYFWSPNDEQLLGLAKLYNDDPAFKANYDRIDPNLAPFIRDAVTIYVANRTK
jgi:DNA-binding transcriptional MerR regulator